MFIHIIIQNVRKKIHLSYKAEYIYNHKYWKIPAMANELMLALSYWNIHTTKSKILKCQYNIKVALSDHKATILQQPLLGRTCK